jgi:DNA-binding winged helix-turn-helix (wHTH) protein/tetratricopeptide (TPR) repeat protein
MPGLVPKGTRYRFGPFELNTGEESLARNGTRVKVQDLPYRLLVMLLERPGEIVTREEVRQRLWPENTFVEFDNSLGVAIRKVRDALNDDAEAPHYVETIPRRGYRFLAPVSVVEGEKPKRTSPTAAVPSSVAAPEHAAAPFSTLRIGLGVAVIFAILGLATLVRPRLIGRTPKGEPASASAATVTARRSVAVLGFHNASGQKESAWLSTALSEMLSKELGAGDQLRLVSGEEVANLGHRTDWTISAELTPDTTSRLGATLASDLLVTGSYTVLGAGKSEKVRLDARVQDSRSGHILSEAAGTSSLQEVLPLVSEIGSKLRGDLALPAVTGDEFAGVRASVSSNLDAERFYSLGLEKMRSYDAVTARDLFEQAVKLDPQFPMAHWALANALHFLGYDKNAMEEARHALDGSAQLPEQERLMIEGFNYETQSDWKKAMPIYRSLYALYPDTLDYGFRLARVEWIGGETAAARESIHRLRQLPSPASSDPRIDLWDARLTASVDRNRSIELAQTAARKAQSLGLDLTYARARLEECRGLGWAGHPKEALVACQEAKNVFLKAGDRYQAALTSWQIADRLSEQSQYAEALKNYNEAIGFMRVVGDRHGPAAVSNNIALIYETQGDFAKAGKLYEEVARVDRELGEISNLTTAMENIASVRSKSGDLAGALKIANESLRIARTSSTEGSVAESLSAVAAVEQMSGDLKQAQTHAQESLEMERKIGDVPSLETSLSSLGDTFAAQGNPGETRKYYDEALDLARKSNANGTVAELQHSLAELSLDQGHAGEAETLLIQALKEFEAEQATGKVLPVQIALARTLLHEGKLAEARNLASAAAKTAGIAPDYRFLLDLSAVRAQIDAAGGKSSAVQLATDLTSLRLRITDAYKRGYFEAAAKGQLALLEIEVLRPSKSAQSRLTELVDSCRTRGYISIANSASAVLARLGQGRT